MDPGLEYLNEKINPILEPLVIDLLAQQPSEPVEFIFEWLEQKYKRKKGE